MRLELIIIGYLLTGCNNSTETSSTSKDSLPVDSSIPLTPDTAQSLIIKTKTPIGIYQTILPCSNCSGIEHTVFFNNDMTFRMEEKELNAKGSITKINGIWQPSAGEIWLYKEQVSVARYTWQGDTLMYIDAKNSKNFALQKLTAATENDVWVKKKYEGIDFFGVGNEPFWSIEIDEQKNIVFHLAELHKPIKFNSPKRVI
jgi:hypothetical protein